MMKKSENKDATKSAEDKSDEKPHDAEREAEREALEARIAELESENLELGEYKEEREADDAKRAEAEAKRGLKITELPREQHQGGMVTPGKRLWLTADKKRLVKEGHVDAATLYCTQHSRVPRAEFERLSGK